MKKGPEYSDSSRKKLVGEYLRNADKLLKSGEYDEALVEVEKSLELEPGNFYAQAYKERITALREKHGRPGEPSRTPPAGGLPGKAEHPAGPRKPPPSPAGDSGAAEEELAGETGLQRGEIPPTQAPPPVETDIAGLRDQLERERATHESETDRQAEEIAMRALEAELQQREEAERVKEEEERALMEAAGDGRAQARRQVVGRAKEAFGELLSGGDTEGAFAHLARIRIVDPDNEDLADLDVRLEAATTAAMKSPMNDVNPLPREIALQWFGRILRSAWGEGRPNRVQTEALGAARARFKVTPEEEKPLLAGIQKEIVKEAVREAYAGGEPDPETRTFLETLARDLSVGDIDSLRPKPKK